MIYGNVVGGTNQAKTFILIDENNNEYPAVFVENVTEFDATPNDIRLGKKAVTDNGVIIGTNDIPSYYTVIGIQEVPVGSDFKIKITEHDAYDFTELQAVMCPYHQSVSNSVSADMVVIDGNVYAVNSNEILSTVTIDYDNQTIDFGITNNSDSVYIIRYFVCKDN